MHDSWGRAFFILTYAVVLFAAAGAWLPALPLAAAGMMVTACFAGCSAWLQHQRLGRALRHHTASQNNNAKKQSLSHLITGLHGGSTIIDSQSRRLQGYGVDWQWIAWLLLPLLVLTTFHILPFGINQATALSLSNDTWPAIGVWSLAPEATWWRLVFLLQLPAFILSGCWLFRHQHVRDLAGIAILLAATHAGTALVLQVLAPDLPNPRAYHGRVRGSFVYPNQAAAYWAAHIPLAIAQARLKSSKRYLLPAALLAIAVVLSASRSAIGITLAVSGCFLWYSLPKKRRWYLIPIAAAGVTILTALNLSPVQQRVSQLADHSADLNGRLGFYDDAMPLIATHWQAGIGAGATATMFTKVDSRPQQSHHVDHLHSDPLELMLEYGLGGGLIITVGLLMALRLLWPQLDGARRWYAIAALTGVGQIFLQSCIDIMFSREAIALTVIVLLIIAAGGRKPPTLISGKTLNQSQRAWPVLLFAAAVSALTAVLPLYHHQQDVDWGNRLAAISRNAQQAQWQEFHKRYVTGLLATPPARGATGLENEVRVLLAAGEVHPELRTAAWAEATSQRLRAWHARSGPATARWWVNVARAAVIDDTSNAPPMVDVQPEIALGHALELAPREPFVLHYALAILSQQAALGSLGEQRQRHWQALARHLALIRPLQTGYLSAAAQLLPQEELQAALLELPIDDLRPVRHWLAGYLPLSDFQTILPKFYLTSASPHAAHLPASWAAVILANYPEFNDSPHAFNWNHAPRPEDRRVAAHRMLRHRIAIPVSWQEKLHEDVMPNPWFAEQLTELSNSLNSNLKNSQQAPNDDALRLDPQPIWQSWQPSSFEPLQAYRFYPVAEWWLRAEQDFLAIKEGRNRPKAVASLRIAAAATSADAVRSEALLLPLRSQPTQWHAIPGGRATVLWHRPGRPTMAPEADQDTLRAVVRNGRFAGWLTSGERNISHLLQPGPQDVAVLPLP